MLGKSLPIQKDKSDELGNLFLILDVLSHISQLIKCLFISVIHVATEQKISQGGEGEETIIIPVIYFLFDILSQNQRSFSIFMIFINKYSY